MDRSDRRAATRVWRAVPWRQRLLVLRLAKRGLRHPDPDVASAAHRYAELIQAHGFSRSLVLAMLIVGAAELAAAAVLRVPLLAALGTGVLLVSWYGYDQRRDATLIQAAQRDPGPSSDDKG
jgi:hypothetical protein